MTARRIWAITDGKAGMVNQALGLAEALSRMSGDTEVVAKTVVPAPPWSWLPAGFWPRSVSGAGAGSDPLAPPWPDIVISCGRHAIGPAVWVKSQSGGRTLAVHAQHPRTALSRFDVVVGQSHDRVGGQTTIEVLGSMHRLTAEVLAASESRFGPSFKDLPRPLVTVLIGGTNQVYKMTRDMAERLADDLLALREKTGCGLLITASRRTGAENLVSLRARLSGEGIYFWDGEGENPYFGFLALADSILVTGDSINMVSEACFTGKPVHVIPLAGGMGSKFERFHEALRAAGHTRRFEGALETWESPRLDETSRAAAEISRRLKSLPSGDGSPQAG